MLELLPIVSCLLLFGRANIVDQLSTGIGPLRSTTWLLQSPFGGRKEFVVLFQGGGLAEIYERHPKQEKLAILLEFSFDGLPGIPPNP